MLRFLGFTNQPNLEHRNAEKIEDGTITIVKCLRIIITWNVFFWAMQNLKQHTYPTYSPLQKIQLLLLLLCDRSWWIIRSKSFKIYYSIAGYVLIESQICQWYLASLRQSVVFFLENESSSCQLPETHTAEISKCHWTSQART